VFGNYENNFIHRELTAREKDPQTSVLMGGQTQTTSVRLRPKAFIIYDQTSAPSADDYLTDTDYPIDLSRRSFSEDGS
jgi:hypothetical protein